MSSSDPIKYYKDKTFELKQFKVAVETFFAENPRLNKTPFPLVHSIKSRFKDPDHLQAKINRKAEVGTIITAENLFEEINDLIGIRILHLYQDQFQKIHEEIVEKAKLGDWAFVEPPKAYTWDPESEQMFSDLGLKTERKDSYYTSVHYIVTPNNENPVSCEIQVRTLFEEAWGEIDHTINYPKPTESVPCKEQLRVLSKLVSTGTRLADSIFRSHNYHESKKESS